MKMRMGRRMERRTERRMGMGMRMRMNIGAMLGFHDELIFGRLLIKRKVAIEYKSRAVRRMRMRM